ncbi:MAG: sigma-70 family RNA polymerase sigma factor [Verrucomicrobia bacterium]|nr:sigma-70 family RNA polymerase sigma factor [Verrucomicrobiota bacterium]
MDPTGREAPPRAAFVTTHWSVVLRAGSKETAQSRNALEQLCRVYWYPLYAHVRRRGHSPEDAQDLTQEFFARLLERQWLARADPASGRFRTFLLVALERFLANAWDKAHAQKRGGGAPALPLRWETAETRYGCEPADPRTPEQAFERRWAITLLDEVLGRLEAEQQTEGKAALFARLKPCLAGESASLPYAQIGDAAGLSEGAVKVAVHRLRQRYRELLRAEIAQTVASTEDVDAEMRHLFHVLARR